MKTVIIPFRSWYYILALLLTVMGYDSSWAQQREISISGIVKSGADNSPLVGVSITANPSSRSVMSSVGGRFNLNINASDTYLVVSYVGFETQKVSISGNKSFDIVLKPSEENIEPVVVTALGIKRTERSLGYSVGKIDGESLNKVAQENLLGGIAGKVSGVTLNQTGGVGSSISMVIRGATSLSSDNQPLYVVDGVPLVSGLNNVSNFSGDRNQVDYGNPIADINPDDVESISILKGPSAAALYGSRAGNGVVLITTKSGKAGEKTVVNFSTNNVFETPVRFLDFHYKYANGNRPEGPLSETSAYWAGPELDKGNLAVQWNSPLDANGNKIPTELVSYKDNMKNFLNTGITNTNNLSVTGSGTKVLYRLGLNNMNHKGMIPNSNLYRNGLSSNITYSILNNLKISSNINIIRSKSNDMPATGNRASNPLQAVYNFSHVNVLDLKDYWLPGQENIKQLQVGGKDNPYFLAYELTNAFKRDRIFGNIKLDWEINDQFSFFFRAAENSSVETRETKIPMSYSRDAKGGYHLQDLKSREDNIDFLLSYKSKDKVSDLNYTLSAGGNYMFRYNTDSYAGSRRNTGLTIPGVFRLSNIPSTGLEINNSEFKKAIYSIYGTANLAYKNQLFLDLTARNDWSSTLPIDNRSYFYPSASLSWVASDTFKLPSTISFLKFRAGIAQVGNDTNPYQLYPVLTTGSWGTSIYMQLPETLLSSNLKPEIATSSEYGMDLNLFNNRLRFDGTYFTVVNKNQILPVATAQSSGYGRKLINAGKLQSKGWEFGLSGTPIRKQDGLVWDVSVNFTNTKTKILELAPGIEYYEYWNDNSSGAMTWVGEEVGNLYSRGYARVNDPGGEYHNWPILDASEGGWIQDNAVENRIKVGNFNPKFLAGMQHSFSYKNFNLGFSLDWRYGGQFLSYTYRYGGSDWKSQHQLDKLIPGGNMNTQDLVELLKSDPGKYIIPHNGNFPRVGGLTKETGGFYYENGGVAGYDGVYIPGVIALYDGSGNIIGYKENLGGPGTILFNASDSFSWNYNQQVAFDADFIKLRELTLGYDIKSIKNVKNLRVSVFTRNIILWTKAKVGIDPERAFQAEATGFKQGIEIQNVSPWTIPFGFKLDLTF